MLDLYMTRTALIMGANLLRVPSERRTPLELAKDGGLLGMWQQAAPETRRMLLLQAAWEARGAFLGEADDDALRHAAYLADAADSAALGGMTQRTDFVHLLGPHYLLAQSLAFDLDDMETSLVATLTLATRIPAGWPM
ncbi:hypothetical protein OTB20_34245 [Streptomyces sp. H27-H1]|uniref:hypothetical protein n=1 Tax=unclassified Streptomyces TaxID=2593676 RepID=UPI002271946D|nr:MULTISPECIES: hypothetical protein [unclassified Streptomyces]MCY0931157.1 hypothetical protein [Streptomyces sp. H27-H1]MCY0939248.1 hypothetical protein [Streptomyces sp. H34-S4]